MFAKWVGGDAFYFIFHLSGSGEGAGWRSQKINEQSFLGNLYNATGMLSFTGSRAKFERSEWTMLTVTPTTIGRWLSTWDRFLFQDADWYQVKGSNDALSARTYCENC